MKKRDEESDAEAALSYSMEVSECLLRVQAWADEGEMAVDKRGTRFVPACASVRAQAGGNFATDQGLVQLQHANVTTLEHVSRVYCTLNRLFYCVVVCRCLTTFVLVL